MKKYSPTYLPIYLTLLLSLVGCAHAPWYEGHYFDAQINGLNVIPIKNKRGLTSLNGFLRYRNVKWMLKDKEKAQGDLHVIVHNNKISHAFIGHVGHNDDLEIYIYALNNQDLESEREFTSSKSVFMESAGIVKDEDVLTSDYMPPGAYVISIKTKGTENWDRKYVYVEFK